MVSFCPPYEADSCSPLIPAKPSLHRTQPFSTAVKPARVPHCIIMRRPQVLLFSCFIYFFFRNMYIIGVLHKQCKRLHLVGTKVFT